MFLSALVQISLVMDSSAFLRVLRSFPTRRSSDLPRRPDGAAAAARRRQAGGVRRGAARRRGRGALFDPAPAPRAVREADRKSTRLNSSHLVNSYSVFCLKKKN